MKNFDLAPIILLIVFVLIPLVNYILNRMGRRFEYPMPTRQRIPDMGMRRQAAPGPSPASAPIREQAQAAPPIARMMPSRRRWSRQTLFRTKRDVRRTIVAMTMLGPCRAYDPPD
jgi:hypothetical protein